MKLKGSKIVQYASLGEEEAGLCASPAFFVCLALRVFFLFCFLLFCFVLSFSLPLGNGGWLRFAIVALPELFC